MASTSKLNVLALDPATKCGWAHSNGTSGTWDLNVKSDESSGMRLLRLRSKLEEVLKIAGIDFLAFESNRVFGHFRSSVVRSEIQGVIKAWCEEKEINYKGYGPQDIKKHATGSTRASKEDMVDVAERVAKKIVQDDNEADAICLLRLAQYDLRLEGK